MNKNIRRRVLLSVLLVAAVGGVMLGLAATNGRSARNSSAPTERNKTKDRNNRSATRLSARKPSGSTDRDSAQRRNSRAANPPSSSCNYACTPANQDALDAAASDAQRIAGRSYYTGAIVDDNANTVTIYLAEAPQSILDQLNAAHPGVYVIQNAAPRPRSAVSSLQAGFDFNLLKPEHIQIVSVGPSETGYLTVGVASKVAEAQSQLDQIYGPNVIRVSKEGPVIWGAWFGRRKPVGFLVGAIRTVGGPAGESRRKGGGLATVFNSRGHAVATERIRPGHDFHFRVASGRYWLGFGRSGRQDRGGCPRPLVTIHAGKTTHSDLSIGCDWL